MTGPGNLPRRLRFNYMACVQRNDSRPIASSAPSAKVALAGHQSGTRRTNVRRLDSVLHTQMPSSMVTRALLLSAFISLPALGLYESHAQSAPKFSTEVLPLLQDKFAPLLQRESGLSLKSWESLMAGSDFGELVIPFDAAASLLIRLATQLDSTDSLRTYADGLTPEDLATVRSWIEHGARNDDGDVAYADSRNLLFAANEGAAAISVIDMDAQLVVRTIRLESLGFSADAKPHHVAVEPDGSAWYVSLIGDDVVLKFDRNHELVGQVAFERPGMLALHPDEDILFVGRSMKAVNPPQRIGMVGRTSMEVEEIDVFFPRPHALAIHPAGKDVFVGSLAENQIAAINHVTGDISLLPIAGPIHTLVQFAVTPDAQTMVAGGQLTGKLFFFDTSDPSQPVLEESIDVGAAPWHPVFSPDGQEVWFGNKMAGTVTVVNMEKRKVAAVIEGMAQPHGSAMRTDGLYVYISNNNLGGQYTSRYNFGYHPGVVAVIDRKTRTVERMLEVGPNATGLGTALR